MKKSKLLKRGFLWLLAVLLFCALVLLWRYDASRRAQRERQLAAEAQAMNANSASVTASPDEAVAILSPEEKYEQYGAPIVPEAKEPVEISCRGDSFNPVEAADRATGYPAKLSSLLSEAGYAANVKDYTWDMSGSLSQMRYAGISEDTVQSYIDRHLEAADGEELRLTETQVRIDIDNFDLSRDDQAAIPVICIGYNGGWNNDLNELIDQQQAILDTFEQQEQFLILGYYPNAYPDPEAYDQALANKWGEHYLPLNRTLTMLDLSDEERQEIAKAIFQKLQEMGYLQ